MLKKKVLSVPLPGVIITQSSTFAGTSLSTDTPLLRMDTLDLFGFRSVSLPRPLSPYFKCVKVKSFAIVFYTPLSGHAKISSNTQGFLYLTMLLYQACFLMLPRCCFRIIDTQSVVLN